MAKTALISTKLLLKFSYRVIENGSRELIFVLQNSNFVLNELFIPNKKNRNKR